MHRYSRVKTKAGEFWVGCSPRGIALIRSAHNADCAFEAAYRKRFGQRPRRGPIPGSYVRAIRDAAAGRPYDPVPMDLSNLSEFQTSVLQKLKKVPRGEIRSYAWLAREVGRPRAARAVGNTMAHNPVPILIPCHRIVPTSGGIGNYGLGRALKRELLSSEGAPANAVGKWMALPLAPDKVLKALGKA